jgi:thiamine pyrophosphate-dependent acetolactate synthase large subunit-like protein
MSAPERAAENSTVVERLAATMAELEAAHVFTLMGAGNLRLVHHLAAEHGVAIHHLRHENGAIGAADGYARVSGRVGWCTVTQGPGFTNTLTALLTAHRARTPLVLVTADSSNLSARQAPFAGGVQGLDPSLLLDPLGIPVIRASAETADADLVIAHHLAARESRTVVFVVPAGLDTAPAGPPADVHPADATGDDSTAGPAPADAVEAAAEAIGAARRPVVLAGRGAVTAGPQLRKLAAMSGAYLATTVRAAGLFHGEPADLGLIGGLASAEAASVIEDADCLVAVGTTLNYFHTRRSRLVRGRTVVHVDRDPAAFTAFDAPTVAVPGDARAVAEQLVDALSRRGVSRSPAVAPAVAPFHDVSEPGRMDPRAVSAELDRLLPRPRRVFVDNGHFGSFPIMHMRHDRPGSLIWLPEFGAVGSALGASAGGVHADPEAQSVLFIGDCGLLLTLGDLELTVREALPLIVVCMNDGAAGSELQHMKDWAVPAAQAVFGYADLAAVARGMGAQAAAVREVGQLEGALAGWERAAGPLLLDCHISRDVRAPMYDHV